MESLSFTKKTYFALLTCLLFNVTVFAQTKSFISPDGAIYTIISEDGTLHGFGTKTKDGLSQIGYWDRSWVNEVYNTLPLQVVKHHLDTAFSKFKVCKNCLTRTTITINTLSFVRSYYDVFVQGEKTGTIRDWDLGGNSNELPGFINNSTQNVYIKAYRVAHNKLKNLDEYLDESFVIKPGEKILGNYRRIPVQGDNLENFFKDKIYFLGQYTIGSNGGNIRSNQLYTFDVLPTTGTTNRSKG